MKIVNIFRTHTEITPYKKGECRELEKKLSIWVQMRKIGRYEPFGYDIIGNVMYVGKGISPYILEGCLGTDIQINNINIVDDYDNMHTKLNMLCEPRSDEQYAMIDFLKANKCQAVLTSNTDEGKTYTMINTIAYENRKSLIIVNKVALVEQWKREICKFTDIEPDRICIVHSSNINGNKTLNYNDYDIYIVTHQTMESIIRNESTTMLKKFLKDIRIGIKVFDEAHNRFKSMMYIDYITNTSKTFYLSASFMRSPYQESRIMNMSFNSASMYGMQNQITKHINYYLVDFDNGYDYDISDLCMISNRFSLIKYEAMLFAKPNIYNTIRSILKNVEEKSDSSKDNKVIIVVSSKKCVDILSEYLVKFYGDEVGVVYSNNTAEENDNVKKHKNLIVTTPKSISEGENIPGLRYIINTVPFASKITSIQLKGRLRKFADGSETHMFDLRDTNTSKCTANCKFRIATNKDIFKTINWRIIKDSKLIKNHNNE